ncbi:uncharacterized protein LOC124270643 [Haliotis rubra]|uniref:uncharacterized protein LOC124270643 n=1 Tax=Haliotis rubra TaxID=36100 RepID=UPI001EE4FDCA|nr:uncharacterized protein LOC124270643 [Haliotis rubra]
MGTQHRRTLPAVGFTCAYEGCAEKATARRTALLDMAEFGDQQVSVLADDLEELKTVERSQFRNMKQHQKYRMSMSGICSSLKERNLRGAEQCPTSTPLLYDITKRNLVLPDAVLQSGRPRKDYFVKVVEDYIFFHVRKHFGAYNS